MRMGMSCQRLVLSAAVFGGVCVAQTVKVAPAKKADNAATLYSLALAELDRSLPQALAKKIMSGAPQQAIQGVFLLQDGNLVAPEVLAERTEQLLTKTVLARSLFAQAATRAKCEFGVAVGRGAWQRETELNRLAELVQTSALSNMEKNPAVTCQDACTLLHYYYHQSSRSGLTDMHALFGKEKRALTLLKNGLGKLRGNKLWDAHVARYSVVLDEHERRRFKMHDIHAAILRGVVDAVELHRGRLRDMHMFVEGGFDQAAMCKRLQAVLTKCMDTPQPGDGALGDWLATVERRLPLFMPMPKEDASVTEKATYGMAQLVLPRGVMLAEDNAGVVRLIGQCRDIMRVSPKAAKRSR